MPLFEEIVGASTYYMNWAKNTSTPPRWAYRPNASGLRPSRGGAIKTEKIGIVTPYKGQCRLLNRVSDAEIALNELDIGSVNTFQGKENDIIILSCGRSNKENITYDRAPDPRLILEGKPQPQDHPWHLLGLPMLLITAFTTAWKAALMMAIQLLAPAWAVSLDPDTLP